MHRRKCADKCLQEAVYRGEVHQWQMHQNSTKERFVRNCLTNDFPTPSLGERKGSKRKGESDFREGSRRRRCSKKVKDEEPVFSGLKLKKSKPVQRKWTEDELEVVELKAHKFEQLPQLEMVN